MNVSANLPIIANDQSSQKDTKEVASKSKKAEAAFDDVLSMKKKKESGKKSDNYQTQSKLSPPNQSKPDHSRSKENANPSVTERSGNQDPIDRISEKNKVESGAERSEGLRKIVEEKTQGVERKDTLTRRGALQGFMSKMKNELEVQPEELVQAFSKLSLEELAMPPEETIESVIGNLDLTLSEKDQAREYFHGMLRQTASTSLAEYMKDSGSDVSIELVSAQELNRNMINKEVDRLSNKFFVDPKATPLDKSMANEKALAQGATLAAVAQGQSAENAFFSPVETPAGASSSYVDSISTPISRAGLDSQLGTGNQQVNSLNQMPNEFVATNKTSAEGSSLVDMSFLDNVEGADQVAAKKPLGPNLNSLGDLKPTAGQQTSDEIQALANEMRIRDNLDSMAKMNIEGKSLAAAEAQNFAQNLAPKMDVAGLSNPALATAGAEALVGAEVMNADSFGQGEGQFTGNNFSEVSVGQTQNIQGEKGEFVVNAKPMATETEESANVREVVNQATYMIKKGGGEMKVKLAPDGLGEVDMKVNVKNGAVNVEMIADSNDAKKIIERGLGELKSAMTAQKLNVENIKVDTSNDTTKDLTQDNKDGDNQFAQKFMNEFRHSNRQWQNGFLGLSGARAYQSQTEDPAQNPLLSVDGKKKPTNAQRRLDLVA